MILWILLLLTLCGASERNFYLGVTRPIRKPQHPSMVYPPFKDVGNWRRHNFSWSNGSELNYTEDHTLFMSDTDHLIVNQIRYYFTKKAYEGTNDSKAYLQCHIEFDDRIAMVEQVWLINETTSIDDAFRPSDIFYSCSDSEYCCAVSCCKNIRIYVAMCLMFILVVGVLLIYNQHYIMHRNPDRVWSLQRSYLRSEARRRAAPRSRIFFLRSLPSYEQVSTA